ncbi:MAG: quinohemoprotein amine dehydrogenase subunit alpha [Gemmatimonadota bacterium]|nr:quinohemoprotein amine dehydrogenase subunit alpha [Gemmatimonadota bacterium]
MLSAKRTAFFAAGLTVLLASYPSRGHAQDDEVGYPITNQSLIEGCQQCHAVDETGHMSRISYLRKTPEGWQTSVRRMAALHNVPLTAEGAREIVRYLSDHQGLAPEELRPALFEVERRLIDHDYEGDSGVEFTCIQCHSMGRVMTQRRTKEEWGLLLATHRGLYPLVDFQGFRRAGPPPTEPGPDGRPPDARHPMDRAIDHLSSVYPLESAEWSAWSATMRSPRLAGTWALSGYEPGKGPIYGTVTISVNPNDDAAFATTASYTYPESDEVAERSGQALVYTGYQWRGRSNPGAGSELREVMFVERNQREMSGRWFTGAYDELGLDIRLQRVGGDAIVTGVYPRAVARGVPVEVRVFGGGLTAGAVADLDFGPGVTVASVNEPSTDGSLRVWLTIADDASIGARDLFAFGTLLEGALLVHDGVDRIAVTPETGMARVGGGAFPKGYQTYEAIGFSDGADGESETDDDLVLGRVEVSWSVEEYAATFGDDDLAFIGSMGQDGVFLPALDGPNPDRAGSRNNVGDAWVIATHTTADGSELRARAHLLVTVPNYMRFEPWREISR